MNSGVSVTPPAPIALRFEAETVRRFHDARWVAPAAKTSDSEPQPVSALTCDTILCPASWWDCTQDTICGDTDFRC
jgi:hypothetical protein